MIEVRNLRKRYQPGIGKRPVEAAVDVSFDVQRGEIFGFLGPNGAGKTTSIKALLGLIRPTSGTVKILGVDPSSIEWRTKVGYMPEHPSFYDYLTGKEMVAWFGRLAGMTAHEADLQARGMLAKVGLGASQDRRIRSYSKGMLQRAGLAQALIASPALLILDEPMTGLDPIGRKEVRDIILSLRDEGRTVFYSTHILPDVEVTCDRVSILKAGRTMRTGKLSEILSEALRGVAVSLAGLSPDAVTALRSEHPLATYHEGVLRVPFPEHATGQRFLEQQIRQGAHVHAFEPIREDLESVFLRTLGADAPTS